MRPFLRGGSMVATAFSFLFLAMALDSRTDPLRVFALFAVSALLSVGSNAALWASLAFPDAD
jgi:hypothetical protein